MSVFSTTWVRYLGGLWHIHGDGVHVGIKVTSYSGHRHCYHVVCELTRHVIHFLAWVITSSLYISYFQRVVNVKYIALDFELELRVVFYGCPLQYILLIEALMYLPYEFPLPASYTQ